MVYRLQSNFGYPKFEYPRYALPYAARRLIRAALSVSRGVRKGSWTSLCNSVCTCSLFRPGSYAAACLFQLTLGNQRLAVVDQHPGFVVVLRTLLALGVGEAACGLGLQQLVAGSLLRGAVELVFHRIAHGLDVADEGLVILRRNRYLDGFLTRLSGGHFELRALHQFFDVGGVLFFN